LIRASDCDSTLTTTLSQTITVLEILVGQLWVITYGQSSDRRRTWYRTAARARDRLVRSASPGGEPEPEDHRDLSGVDGTVRPVRRRDRPTGDARRAPPRGSRGVHRGPPRPPFAGHRPQPLRGPPDLLPLGDRGGADRCFPDGPDAAAESAGAGARHPPRAPSSRRSCGSSTPIGRLPADAMRRSSASSSIPVLVAPRSRTSTGRRPTPRRGDHRRGHRSGPGPRPSCGLVRGRRGASRSCRS